MSKPSTLLRNAQTELREPCGVLRKPQTELQEPCGVLRKPQTELREPCGALRKLPAVFSLFFLLYRKQIPAQPSLVMPIIKAKRNLSEIKQNRRKPEL